MQSQWYYKNKYCVLIYDMTLKFSHELYVDLPYGLVCYEESIKKNVLSWSIGIITLYFVIFVLFDFVDHIFLLVQLRQTFEVAIIMDRCLTILSTVTSGHMKKFSFLMSCIQVVLFGSPQRVCIYQMSSGVIFG